MAIKMHRKALEVRIAVLGPHHPDVGVSYEDLAAVFAKMGDHDTALELHRKSLGSHVAALSTALPTLDCSLDSEAAVQHLVQQLRACPELLDGRDSPSDGDAVVRCDGEAAEEGPASRRPVPAPLSPSLIADSVPEMPEAPPAASPGACDGAGDAGVLPKDAVDNGVLSLHNLVLSPIRMQDAPCVSPDEMGGTSQCGPEGSPAARCAGPPVQVTSPESSADAEVPQCAGVDQSALDRGPAGWLATATHYNNMAKAHYSKGNYVEALQMYQKVQAPSSRPHPRVHTRSPTPPPPPVQSAVLHVPTGRVTDECCIEAVESFRPHHSEPPKKF